MAMSHPQPSTSKKKKDEEDEFSSWDPLGQDFYSVQNLIGADIGENAAAFVLGVKDNNKNPSWGQIPCPFYKGEGRFCWKGPSCRMRHEIVDPTELGKEIIATTYTLDDKPTLHRGSWLQVGIQHVISPSEFFILPTISPSCGCEAVFPSREAMRDQIVGVHSHRGDMNVVRTATTGQVFGTGLKAFETIQRKLTQYLQTNMNYRSQQTPHYAQFQLVAVKRETTIPGNTRSSRIWYRAEVLETNVTDVEGRDLPWHIVQLLDTGERIQVRADDLCILPMALSYYHAMAFKCCLDGVGPVGGGKVWDSAAVTAFKDLTPGHKLMMMVKSVDGDLNEDKTIESRPYFVNLFRTSSNGSPPISVAQELVERGLAAVVKS